MLIRDLFTKAIDRPINGVIKADQDDDESVWQELDEYVVTKELDVHLRDFIGAYLDALDNPGNADVIGKVGIWVSGFFGSGKSHFIKVLSYLLENRQVAHDGVTKTAIDFFDGKIQDAMLAGDLKRAVGSDCDVVLFNIDSKADATGGSGAVLRVFLKVLNEKLGYSGDHPHIAHMERYLDRQGKLAQFRDEFKKASGADWEQERDAYQFRADQLAQALSATLEQSEEATRKWLDTSEQAFNLSVENFAKWVKEYLDSRGPDHRIIFLVDEIGQFIGQDTHLMLNLQTIVENLGTACQGRAWVVVTSQEDIDAVIGEVRASAANDFSKIQGRFKTRLSLSSANVDEVIQKRLLGKTDAAQAELAALYRDQADILKNQLSFTNVGMTFKPYADGMDFVNVYPFAPYQFQLVQKIFEAIRRHGVTGIHLARGERSMLDAFQSAAIQVADEETGILVPLYRFYPAIESFLEGVVKSTIDQAQDNARLDQFDVKVLKTLFLIRYVDEIRGNVDNLVTLFVDRIDAGRLDLRGKIEASLQRLEKETLINRNGDDFFFLTNEERDISREIKDVDLSGPEEAKFLGDLIFDDVLSSLRKHRFPDNRKDFGLNRFCDGHPHGNRTEGDLLVAILTPLADDYESCSDTTCSLRSSADGGQVIVKLDDDKTLGRELRTYLQTDKYVARKRDGTTTPTINRILQDRQAENRERRQRLVTLLDRLLKEGACYAAGQSLQPRGGSAKAALEEAITYLIKNTFTKLNYISRLSANPRAEIRAVLTAGDVADLGGSLTDGQANRQALAEVLSTIQLLSGQHRQIVLHELVENRFGCLPYGWPDWEVILLVARLVRQGEISLVMEGATLSPDRIYDAVITPNKWRRILVMQRKTVDKPLLQKTRELAKEVFGNIAPDGEDALAGHLRGQMAAWQGNLKSYQGLAQTGNYPGRAEIKAGLTTLDKLLAEHESFDLITKLLEHEAELLDLCDDAHDLDNFYTSQRPTWEKLRKAAEQFQLNRKWLDRDETSAAALRRMETILNSEAPYGMIKEAEGLIHTVEGVDSRIVGEARERALQRIDASIAKVTAELDTVKADSGLRNGCLYPLQTLRGQVEQQSSMAHIFEAQSEVEGLSDDALKKIEESGGDGNGEKQPVIKSRRIIQAGKLSTKAYLETQEDIDEFLAKLRQELEKAIEDNERIEIR